MTWPIGLHTVTDLIHEHWLSAFFILLTLTTIVTLWAVRWYVRRQLRKMIEERYPEESELDLLPEPSPADRKAAGVVKRFRRQVWEIPENELQLGFDVLGRRALTIVRAIGAVYHPEAEDPEYEASLHETLQLVKRVSTRLARLTSTVPVKYIGNRKLSDFQRYYQVYLKINENPILQLFKKNPHLYRAARIALNVKNIANPLYWASRELTREGYFFILRWFYVTFAAEVGREAIGLFSGRRFRQDEDRDAALVCYRLFHVARKWGGPSAAEWAAFVDFVSTQPAIEAETKVHVLSRCAEGRLPKDVEEQRIVTKSGRKWYSAGLKRLLDADEAGSASKTSLVAREMTDADQESEVGGKRTDDR